MALPTGTRSAISRRKPATRSCAVLMSSRTRSCIRCASYPVSAKSSWATPALWAASAVSMLRLITSTFASAIASADKVWRARKCRQVGKILRSGGDRRSESCRFAPAADHLVKVLGRLEDGEIQIMPLRVVPEGHMELAAAFIRRSIRDRISNLNEWSPNRVVEDAIASNLRTDYGTHR